MVIPTLLTVSFDKKGYAFGQPVQIDNFRFHGNSERECLGFNEIINLSNNSLVSSPRISASGENVFVVWEEGQGGKSNIIYRHSNDSGTTFGPAISISSDPNVVDVANNAIQPDISSFANDVYIVWKSQQSGIYLKHSNDSGTTFGPAITLANNTNVSDLKLAASEDNVYIVWKSQQSGIYLKHSNDSGTTFGPAITLANNTTTTTTTTNVSDLKLAASEDNVYIVWKSQQSGIYLKHSNDSRLTFDTYWLRNNDNNSLVSSPRISASGENVFVVWEEGQGGKSNIIYRHSNDGGATFSPETYIDNILALKSVVYQPEVTNYANNNVLLKINSIKNGVLIFSSNDSGTTFGPAITLANNTNVSDLKLAASEDNVYIVWKNSSILNNNIFFEKLDQDYDKVAMDAVRLSDNVGLPVSAPSISASGENVFVVWEEGQGGKSNIIYRHSNDSGTTFGPAISISSDPNVVDVANDAIQPDISSFANDVYIVWKSQQSGIYLKHSNDSGTTFGPAITLANNTNVSDLKLAASEDNVYIVWKSQQSGIYLKHSNDSGTTFGPAITLANNTNVSDLKLAASEDNVYIVWKDAVRGNPAIFFKKSLNNAQDFEPVVRITQEDMSGYSPKVQINSNDLIYLVWNSAENGLSFSLSADGGSKFSNIKILTNNTNVSDLKLAASEDNVYIVWKSDGFSFLKFSSHQAALVIKLSLIDLLEKISIYGLQIV